MKPIDRARGLRTAVFGIGTAALLTLGAGVVAPSAGASSLCNQNTSCYWGSTNFSGTPWVAPSCGVWFVGGVWSVKNYGHGTVWLYDANGYRITSLTVGQVSPNLGRPAYSEEINC
jgi:hypothetical protein